MNLSLPPVPDGGPHLLSAPHKKRALALLALTEFLGMSVWFAVPAVVPPLTAAWGLTPSGQAWLTMSVQLGFVGGALTSALLNLADLVPGRWLFAGSSVLAGAMTILIPAASNDLFPALVLRFMTGVFLAGGSPVRMTIMAP